MEFLSTFFTREVVIWLAVLGAVIATIGSFFLKAYEGKHLRKAWLSKLLMRSGYGITWLSVLIFIIIGFFGFDSN